MVERTIYKSGKLLIKIALTVLVLLLFVNLTWAFKPAVLFDTQNLDDKGFIGNAYIGVLAFEKFRNQKVTVVTPAGKELKSEIDFVEMVRSAARDGYNPILGVSFTFGPALKKVAPEFPETRFVALDATVNANNVMSIVFHEEEGSLLVGYLAAMASKSGKLGFVGGMDSPLIRQFGCAFAQGALHRNPDIEIYTVMAGKSVEAFVIPEKGYQLAMELADKGVDIIFSAAGMTGIGVIEAAVKRGIMVIGVDSNQNYLAPDNMLTSMLKRMDVAMFMALSQAMDNQWSPGEVRLGLKAGAIDWAMDKHNIIFITEEMLKEMDNLTFEIITGMLDVHNYTQEFGCPYAQFSLQIKKTEWKDE